MSGVDSRAIQGFNIGMTKVYRIAKKRQKKPFLSAVTNVFVSMTADVSGVDKKAAISLLEDLAQSLGYTVVGRASHAFKPHGVTVVLLLSESHLSIHTWPEREFAVVEMVTCKRFGRREARIFRDRLESRFAPRMIRIQTLL